MECDIGRKFLNLVKKCFYKGHILEKAFNRNNLKVSYRTMPNVASKISAHNRKILQKADEQPGLSCGPKPDEQPGLSCGPKPNCNCRNKANCPLQGDCLTESIVYRATVKRGDKETEEIYVGLTGG